MIRPIDKPLAAHGGIAVLRGNLAPQGAVLKPSAASPHLMRTAAARWSSRTSSTTRARIDDPALDVDAGLRARAEELRAEGLSRAWPRSATWGCRRRCCSTGVTDMVRISDARMSGTAYGTVVLHVAPEAAAGGPLALVRDGDMIELDVEQRRLHLDVPTTELARAARGVARAGAGAAAGGYAQLYIDHVLQADQRRRPRFPRGLPRARGAANRTDGTLSCQLSAVSQHCNPSHTTNRLKAEN